MSASSFFGKTSTPAVDALLSEASQVVKEGTLSLKNTISLNKEFYTAENGFQNSADIVKYVASGVANKPLDDLLIRLSPAEKALFNDNPRMRNMLLGQMVHRDTDATLV